MGKEYARGQFAEDPLEVADVWREGIMPDPAGKTGGPRENEIAEKPVGRCAEARGESTGMRRQMSVEAMRGTEGRDEGCAKTIADPAAGKGREHANMAYGPLVGDNWDRGL